MIIIAITPTLNKFNKQTKKQQTKSFCEQNLE